jgi:hypothetical protein
MSTLREALARAITGAESGDRRPSEERQADAALSALRQWLTDEGLVVVPREATAEMKAALMAKSPLNAMRCKLAWDHMIAAAPDVLGKP